MPQPNCLYTTRYCCKYNALAVAWQIQNIYISIFYLMRIQSRALDIKFRMNFEIEWLVELGGKFEFAQEKETYKKK